MPETPKPSDLMNKPHPPHGAHSDPEQRGRTVMADGVVEKIAGMAAREVPGIHALGSGLARTLGAMRDRASGGRTSVSRGIKAEVGERQTAIDIALIVEYGAVIPELAAAVRRNIVSAVERLTGLEVVEVNIAVNDVHLPDESEEEEELISSERRARVH